MKILGVEPGVQVIILQGLSTYTALLSAYFFARPVLRGQTTQSNREILIDIKSSDPEVSSLIEQASEVLNRRIQNDQPLVRRDNRFGIILLVVSLSLFTGAIALQIITDPLFMSATAH
jgi:hypothetical protein